MLIFWTLQIFTKLIFLCYAIVLLSWYNRVQTFWSHSKHSSVWVLLLDTWNSQDSAFTLAFFSILFSFVFLFCCHVFDFAIFSFVLSSCLWNFHIFLEKNLQSMSTLIDVNVDVCFLPKVKMNNKCGISYVWPQFMKKYSSIALLKDIFKHDPASTAQL